MTERNPLVSSGKYARVYVCELATGEIDAFGRKILSVRSTTGGTKVAFSNGEVGYYRKRDATILIKTDSIKD